MKYFFLILSFFVLNAHGNTKVAIVDAFFCQKKINHRNIQIKKIQDMTEEKNPFGEKCENTRQFHGQKVLSTLIDFYKGQKSIEIYAYKVFNKNGNQDSEALKKALQDISNQKIDLIVMAIGFKNYSDLPKSLPALTFASSGSSGNGILANDKLWPQMLEDEKLVLFAHYFPSTSGVRMIPEKVFKGHIDPSLMYLDRIRFLVSSPANPSVLSGTSYAVAKASGIILSQCLSLKNIDECFRNFSGRVNILNSSHRKTFSTIL